MRYGFALVFALFAILFIAIVVEEAFLGGRKRRRAEKMTRQRQENASGQE